MACKHEAELAERCAGCGHRQMRHGSKVWCVDEDGSDSERGAAYYCIHRCEVAAPEPDAREAIGEERSAEQRAYDDGFLSGMVHASAVAGSAPGEPHRCMRPPFGCLVCGWTEQSPAGAATGSACAHPQFCWTEAGGECTERRDPAGAATGGEGNESGGGSSGPGSVVADHSPGLVPEPPPVPPDADESYRPLVESIDLRPPECTDCEDPATQEVFIHLPALGVSGVSLGTYCKPCADETVSRLSGRGGFDVGPM